MPKFDKCKLIRWSGTRDDFISIHRVKEFSVVESSISVTFFGNMHVELNEAIEIDGNLYIARNIEYRRKHQEGWSETEVKFGRVTLAEDSPEARQEFLKDLPSHLEQLKRFGGPVGQPRKPMIRPEGSWRVAK
jgi:hypothetical protein